MGTTKYVFASIFRTLAGEVAVISRFLEGDPEEDYIAALFQSPKTDVEYLIYFSGKAARDSDPVPLALSQVRDWILT